MEIKKGALFHMWGFIRRSMRPVALVVAACLVWVPSYTVVAAATTPAPRTVLTETQKQLVDKSMNFTQYTTTGIVFDKAGALSSGLPESFVNDMAGLYQRMNDKAAKDQFQWDKLIDAINVRKSSPPQASPRHDNSPPVGPQWKMPGTVEPDWSRTTTSTYVQVTFTEWETSLIINAMWAGAGASGVYAALAGLGIVTLPFAGIIGLVTALLCFGAGTLGFIDTLGHNNGVYFRLYIWGTISIWHN